jgi:hypothetical protein
VNYNKFKKCFLYTEDISNNSPQVKISEEEGSIYSFIFNEAETIFLSGNMNGHISQYNLEEKTKTWKLHHIYPDLKIGAVISFTNYGGLVFAGGDKRRIKLIYVAFLKILDWEITAGIGFVNSIQICPVTLPRSLVYLAVTGGDCYYWKNSTDLYMINYWRQRTVVQGMIRSELTKEDEEIMKEMEKYKRNF